MSKPQARNKKPAPEKADPKGVDKLLEGIQYADVAEDPIDSNVAAAAGEDQLERLEKQRVAAKEAGQVYFIPSLLNQKPRPPTPEEEAELLSRKRYFIVMEDRTISRGAATYRLPAGKVFDNNQYDVDSLERQGVRLKEIKDPSGIVERPDF